MRTTLTLDPDVADRLKTLMRRTGKSFKQTVNEVLRLGLGSMRKRPPRTPFTVRARPLGLRSGLSVDSIGDLLEQVEGPAHR